MSGQLHWQQITVGGEGGHAAILRDDEMFYGWVTSSKGKAWIAWAPPKDAPKGQPINVMRDGQFLGLYDDVKNAMTTVKVKCTGNR